MPELDLSALIPGFYSPASILVNPEAEEAEEIVIQWLWRIGFLTTTVQEKHLRSFRFGLYHGIATPDWNGSQLILGMKWFCWGSLADDQYDNYNWGDRESRMRSVIQNARDVLAGYASGAVENRAVATGETGKNPVIQGLVEFWPALLEGMSASARLRIAQDFLDYLEAVLVQNRYHASERIPDLATFVELRRHTIAMIFQADVLEALAHLDIPELLRNHRIFRELIHCFADITAWHNDVYGLEKDLIDKQTCNMVRVVSAAENRTLEEAVSCVIERAKDRQRLFLEMENELPALIDRLNLPAKAVVESQKLTRLLRAYVFANLLWHRSTERYALDIPRIHGIFDDILDSSDQR